MAQRHTTAHFLHDAGLAVWFGGSLMGAVGLNGAAATLDDPTQRTRAANAGWNRWTPVNAVAIGAHLLGAVRLLQTERGRVKHQSGVAANSVAKTGVTAAALAATALARRAGSTMSQSGDQPVAGTTEPSAQTPGDVAAAQKKLKALQWAIPGLTGTLIALGAQQEEQMRPGHLVTGMLRKPFTR